MANASEYWNPLKWLISYTWDAELPDKLIERGWVDPEKKAEVAEILKEHEGTWAEDDYNSHCQCGKWLEHGYYEHPDHLADVLEDSGLLLPCPECTYPNVPWDWDRCTHKGTAWEPER